MPDTAPHGIAGAAKAALRIAAGVAFWSHGAQKMLGWFGGTGPDGGTVELMSRYGIAGVIELVGGFLLFVGLFTRPGSLPRRSGLNRRSGRWSHIQHWGCAALR
jgi:uncharacterized membrane protein YphA (DoxX/SURF4 family)